MTTLLSPSGPSSRARTRWLLPAIAALSALALVVGVSEVSAGRGTARPPVLRLATFAGSSAGFPALAAAGGGGQLGGAPGGSEWRLEGILPGGPTSAPVRPLTGNPVPRAFVVGLAAAFGLHGEPQRLTGGWYLADSLRELSVSELSGQAWSYRNHGCLAGPSLDPTIGVGCAIAKGLPPIEISRGPLCPRDSTTCGTSSPPRKRTSGVGPGEVPPAIGPTGAYPDQPIDPPVSAELARSVAAPVLAAVGLSVDAAVVATEGSQQAVVVHRLVAGSTVVGLDTRVSVDEHGVLSDSSGYLANATTGPTYPLITAQQAFDSLRTMPVPMIAMPCRIQLGISGCAPLPDHVVTGAVLGLSAAYGFDHRAVLVPSWLFQVRGEDPPVAVVAIQRQYLAGPVQPAPGRSAPGSLPGGAGGSGPSCQSSVGYACPGTNGTTEQTGGPTQVAPAPPATKPTG